ncbi:Protein T23G7.2 a [Aphelenchoides avenae]|nr:Protein T23G7.2 a [Aphelenchus avenae]
MELFRSNVMGGGLIRVVAFFASLFVGCALIDHFGTISANRVTGYQRGNRFRVRSVLKLEWLSAHLTILIYWHLFSFFKKPYSLFQIHEKNALRVERLRQRLFVVFLVVMTLAHVSYLLYLPDFVVPWPLWETTALCIGLWMHLFFFSAVFECGKAFRDLLKSFNFGRQVLDVLYRIPLFERLATDNQFQVAITLTLTALLASIQWISLQVRFLLRLAVLTDLHGGASVYQEQIARVVDKTNALEADAILIIGDAIDAPRALIEDRMEPLRHLRARIGTFFVTGNHEYYYGNVQEWFDLFESYGIKNLRNEKVDLEGVCLVGLNDISSNKSGIFNHTMSVSAIEQCPSDRPTVVMEHNPAATRPILEYSKANNHRVDLILSGHTHAGQYYLLTPYVYFCLPYWYGLYEVNDGATKLLVSAGTLYQGAPMKMAYMSQIWHISITRDES